LIDNNGVVKIADFGLARSYAGQDSTNPLTNRVITLWYRPPELLLGTTKYGPEVDMWSVGCIFAELVMGKPILPGKNEMEQVDLIFRLCGTPSEEVWPGCGKLPWYHMFKPDKPHRRRLLEQLARAPADVQDLCDKLLALDPAKRLRADAALLHDYFFNDPQPCAAGQLPKYESSHEFQTKKRRQEQRAKADADAAAKRAHTEAAVLAAGGMTSGGARQGVVPAYPHAAGGHAAGGMHPYGVHAAVGPIPGASHGAPGTYGGVYSTSAGLGASGMGMGVAYGAPQRGAPPSAAAAPGGVPRAPPAAYPPRAPGGSGAPPSSRPPQPPPAGGSRPH
jgi:cyclin-dependent kinase 12/13